MASDPKNSAEPERVDWERILLDELWSSGEQPATLRARLQDRLGKDFDLRASDEDIQLARHLLFFVTEAIAFGSEKVREPYSTLLRAMDALVRDGGGKEPRRRAVLAHTEAALGSWRSTDDGPARDAIADRLRLDLSYVEGPFGYLETSAVKRELGRSERREAARVAAELAVSVKAFGDDDVEKSRKRFLDAVTAR